jgi:hypothetical protein
MNNENAFILVTLCGDVINWDFATTFGAIQISSFVHNEVYTCRIGGRAPSAPIPLEVSRAVQAPGFSRARARWRRD